MFQPLEESTAAERIGHFHEATTVPGTYSVYVVRELPVSVFCACDEMGPSTGQVS